MTSLAGKDAGQAGPWILRQGYTLVCMTRARASYNRAEENPLISSLLEHALCRSPSCRTKYASLRKMDERHIFFPGSLGRAASPLLVKLGYRKFVPVTRHPGLQVPSWKLFVVCGKRRPWLAVCGHCRGRAEETSPLPPPRLFTRMGRTHALCQSLARNTYPSRTVFSVIPSCKWERGSLNGEAQSLQVVRTACSVDEDREDLFFSIPFKSLSRNTSEFFAKVLCEWPEEEDTVGCSMWAG